ncbi:MAG: T9SS type A sorting domain-containing protein [Crocinitomicaceae bacterium]|nr:T9SS type A sorting domain-containing protein [Crocinitomicaceae bacterium]
MPPTMFFLTGTYSGTVDFDPNGGAINLVSQGVLDVFILKLDNSGNYFWAKSIGGPDYEESNSICVDQYGCAYITGRFEGNVDFDPGPEVYNILAPSDHIFIAKVNSAGDFKWAGEIGTTAQSVGLSIVRDASQNLYISGGYTGPADFDIGPGVFNMTGLVFDVFVLKMNGCTPSAGTDVQYACDSLTWIDGITYYASNNSVTYVLTNSTGCDSVVTLNLTLHHSDSVTDVQIACDDLTWIDGNNYTSTNSSAIHTLTNIFGCDSVVSLDLTIVNSSSSTDTHTACNSFVWMDGNNYTASNTTATYITINSVGCDSTITLNLTLNLSDNTSDVQVHCDSYVWTDGNTYTSSNNSATQTLTNMFGCDSVVTLDLTIEISPVANATNAGDGTLVGSGGDTYQWIDCGTNLPVIGATSATFVPLTNGDYSVVASTGLCSDTSGCANYNSVGLTETSSLPVSTYPNPTKDLIIIKSPKDISGSIIIRDNSGRIILQTPIHSNETVVDLSHLESGIYFITILDTSFLQTTTKVIKM